MVAVRFLFALQVMLAAAVADEICSDEMCDDVSLLQLRGAKGMTTTGSRVLHVAPTGAAHASDSRESGSRTTPFATVEFAAKQAQPGDTILMLPGVYHNEHYGDGDIWKDGEHTIVIRKVKGSPGNPITLMAEKLGDVVIRGDGRIILELKKCKHWRVKNLEIEGEVARVPLEEALHWQFAFKRSEKSEVEFRVDPSWSKDRIKAVKLPIIEEVKRPSKYNTHGLNVHTSYDVEVSNCHIHHMPGSALKFRKSDYIVAKNNEIHDSTGLATGGNHALTVNYMSAKANPGDYHAVITGNRVYNNVNYVYSWVPSKSFITPEVDEGKGISVQFCWRKNGFKAGRILIANNIAYGNGFSGIHVNKGERVDVLFNTVVDNDATEHGRNHGITSAESSDIRIENNVVATHATWKAAAVRAADGSREIVVRNNVVYGSVEKAAAEVQEGTMVAEPRFENRESGDFKLAEGSRGKGECQPLPEVTDDAEGNVRSATPSCGAYE
mmetsp:Transcript_21425/g.52007  ORF Transcript_21425/g.52007 Transcript_21425/m.52007 type:complete len:496 (+) Transcript_21425:96-1583(+)